MPAPLHPPAPHRSSVLTARQQATLAAVVRRVVPTDVLLAAAHDARAERLDATVVEPARAALDALPTRVAERIARLPAGLAAEIALALDLFGAPLAALGTVGRAAPYAALSTALQDRMLARWLSSPIGPCRTVAQALRRLALATAYAEPAVARLVGHRGPLHLRDAAVSWEGALAGTPDAREPVARAVEPVARALWHRRAAPAGTAPASVTDGSALRGAHALDADVVVIGTGAGGAVVAARLAERGVDVVLLERGRWWDPADFTEEEGPLTERLYADRGLRATTDLGVLIFQGEAVGGSTTVNWLVMLRTPERVLDEWAREHGAEGLDAATMDAAFAQVEQEVRARVVPDDAHSMQNRLLLDGARRLGWRAYAAAINAAGCVRAGFCGVGCRHDARQGAQAVYVRRALAAGARLVTHADVARIETAERDGPPPLRRVHATLRDDAGAPVGTLAVRARRVVLAAGAIGTPAILQRAALGNAQVGRWLRLHPTTAVVGRYAHEVYGAGGIPLSTVCDEFADLDAHGYGFWIECPPLQPSIAAAGLAGFGAAHAATMARYRHLGAMVALVRDGAERTRSSGDVRVGRDGRPRIRYRLSATDRRHLAAAVEATARLTLAAGAEEALTLHTDPVRVRGERDLAAIARRAHGANRITVLSAHVTGSCRLGADRRTAATRPDFALWDAPGVYVCDGSLLPTAPGVNPQATIMALATVMGEGLGV